MNPADLHKRAVQLRATIDQLRTTVERDDAEGPEIEPGALLDQVFAPEELADIENTWPKLHNALLRLEEDFGHTLEAANNLDCSLDAVDAISECVQAAEEQDAEDEVAPTRGRIVPDDDADDNADDDADPDAGLDPERN